MNILKVRIACELKLGKDFHKIFSKLRNIFFYYKAHVRPLYLIIKSEKTY